MIMNKMYDYVCCNQIYKHHDVYNVDTVHTVVYALAFASRAPPQPVRKVAGKVEVAIGSLTLSGCRGRRAGTAQPLFSEGVRPSAEAPFGDLLLVHHRVISSALVQRRRLPSAAAKHDLLPSFYL